jgi:hypothetical protein
MGTGVGGFGSIFGGTEDGGGSGNLPTFCGRLPVNVGGGDFVTTVGVTTFCVTGCGGGTMGTENGTLGLGTTGDLDTGSLVTVPPEVVAPEAHLSQEAPW